MNLRGTRLTDTERLPSNPSDPSVGPLIVESDAFTITLKGPASVIRGAGLSAEMSIAEAMGAEAKPAA
jgi:hypothetical protein